MARLLFCDDLKTLREMFLMRTKSLGHQGKTVGNCGEVLLEVQTGRKYDIVFLDLQHLQRYTEEVHPTRRLEAYDLTEKIKERSPDTLVIGVSGNPRGYLSDLKGHFNGFENNSRICSSEEKLRGTLRKYGIN